MFGFIHSCASFPKLCSMSEYDYDLFVIGCGSAGVRLSRIAAQHGARVAVCEPQAGHGENE